MATREVRAVQGRRLGERLEARLLNELRERRVVAGVSQRALAREMRCTQAEYWRLENGRIAVDLVRLAEAGAVLGLTLSAGFHPAGEPVRDAGQQALIRRFRKALAPAWHVTLEAPFPTLGDLRSWDMLLRLGTAYRVGVEAETRIRDEQELVRRIRQRELHGGADDIVVVLSDSAHNRRHVEGLRVALGERYGPSTRSLLGALRAGVPLRSSGVLLF